jgi:adenylate cyclase
MEIERKFLVSGEAWRADATLCHHIRQGYLSRDPERVVRVRIKDDAAFLTVKGRSQGTKALVRPEFEYPLPVADAEVLLAGLCLKPNIEKRRHIVPGPDGKIWEVDEFVFPHPGLILAEIELTTADEEFALPSWAGREVTHDHRYANNRIATAVLD